MIINQGSKIKINLFLNVNMTYYNIGFSHNNRRIQIYNIHYFH